MAHGNQPQHAGRRAKLLKTRGEMSMSMTKKMMLGTAIAAATVVAGLAPASAHGRHHQFYGMRGPVVVAPSYLATCDYFHWKWQRTGSRYWRAQYFDCIR
jgi:hypothetical protein